ncbi:helix-turn-helix transcriptional regulator [Herbiconiux moechotypicola]|uniref:Helix-turn-helix transcriptional regulator n=1 Tax=Herbiconiux moechotypicola TaxID=637393 RepID=A0ABN3DL62_9MICO|nr:helix-turn-helix transcriptional regulator [Herbiconiux moechotypicola]MCS5730119.1 helix-turn-helix transcriptional regulator [Herbiconiux moechotypicola]
MDVTAFGEFVRARREALQPEDVGLRRGTRRRTSGLRREEVAELAGMSTDYLARLERGDGIQPSEQITAALARALRLSLAERDHLFLLAGHRPPARTSSSEQHVSPGLMRILDRLADTPAQIIGSMHEVLVQNAGAIALLGDQTSASGGTSDHRRSAVYRWFLDPDHARRIYPAEHHPHHSEVRVAQLRASAAAAGPGSDAAALVERLKTESPEFAEIWNRGEVALRYSDEKRFVNEHVGELDLFCQVVMDPDQLQSLLVFTATPGTESAEKLELLMVVGSSYAPTSLSAR